MNDTRRGATVEADGNAPTESAQLGGGVSLAFRFGGTTRRRPWGPNNELLEQAATPRLVNALRELVVKFSGGRGLSRGGTKSGASGKRGSSGKGCNTPFGIRR